MDRLERPQEQGIFELKITDTVKAHLLETARWAKFLATISIILMVIGSIIFIGSLVVGASTLNSGGAEFVMMSFVYIVIILLYIYPIIALYRFATYTKRAFAHGNQGELEKALWYQRNLFKFLGIITIIVLVLYGITIAIVIGFTAINA
jgi:hypothetical protein